MKHYIEVQLYWFVNIMNRKKSTEYRSKNNLKNKSKITILRIILGYFDYFLCYFKIFLENYLNKEKK